MMAPWTYMVGVASSHDGMQLGGSGQSCKPRSSFYSSKTGFGC